MFVFVCLVLMTSAAWFLVSLSLSLSLSFEGRKGSCVSNSDFQNKATIARGY